MHFRPNRPTLTQRQVAALAGVSERTLRRWQADGCGPRKAGFHGYEAGAVGQWLAGVGKLYEARAARSMAAALYRSERARLYRARADLLGEQVRRMRGDAVPAAEVSGMRLAIERSVLAKLSALVPSLVRSLEGMPHGPSTWRFASERLAEAVADALDANALAD